ncbi:MAG TPA: tRNA (adenosine(37)-N6)-threonylcarbamoyltransferase complex transferase subunit TsaD [Candidatus Hydrogenedentes bacterium]|nr:tRNA (adenosine(37)-N6)-threonylcarbamoyltransferase complex transferase subunit TsaD [Candidatus Hydrogenedentota bacterium]
MSLILGIETSCDETGIALVEDGRRVIAETLLSQVDIHRVFGGVVPEIASRKHIEVIYQLTRDTLAQAGLDMASGRQQIDAVAATRGPGLMGSLLVGMGFARSLAWAWRKPFVPVHHIEGHLYAAFLGERVPQFPFLALIVSGGHTQLVYCPEPLRYELLGTTRDDAVGECFDKVARLLGLPYPGGPSIQKAAQTGNPDACHFPRAMRDSDTLDFSYSGLKTAVLYMLRDHPDLPVPDVAASFQRAAVDMLLERTEQAIARTGCERLVVAGGVAANALLRESVQQLGVEVYLPAFRWCLDNGAMIACAAHYRLQAGCADHTLSASADPSLDLICSGQAG